MEKKNVTKIVTIKDLWEIFVHRLWIIVLAAAISASGLFAFVSLTFVPQYSSTATMYILRQANENVSSSEASSDFSLALKVVNDCDYLLKSVPVLGEVMNTLDLSSEYEDMEDMAEHITTFNPADTRILEITIEARSPEIAKNIVDALGEIGAKKINDAMGFDQVNLYALGEVEYEPCNKTSILTYILVGIVAAIGVYCIFLVMFLMDDTLKTDEDCQKYLGLSILGDIPDADMTQKKKYGYYRGYGYRSKYQYKYSRYGGPTNMPNENGKENTK